VPTPAKLAPAIAENPLNYPQETLQRVGPVKPVYSAPGRRNYMVYRVFTVYSGPAIVHNLFKLCYPAYFVITPQAMRSPAFPAGSVFISSGLA
jgi:hypothetical protein